ncbi:aminopeptidase P family protein [Chitinophaga nivalis]|uniref:Xaa-Pro aminopeptidase n=1 Tax=Chitinophaga nivalis TaxID=2991709 RepID=A0ABT3IJP8_9BACT|nr:aminopeptidase P family protein [Chitinophaga nivalis]MCW3466119.1 Xaa-Pro aminopeptidase [Chitinophaga nivalis]MCW3484190.1 Xaa-Pro aminopeptidase [Chitinophaga nivalis]
MFSAKTYIDRRSGLQAAIGSGIILLPGNDDTGMNYKDNIYPFRQDSSFLYYAGIDRPGLTFIIDADNNREILFGDESTVEDIVWTGSVDSLVSQAARAGIADVRPLSQLPGFLAGNKQTIHFLSPYRADITLKLSSWLDIPAAQIPERVSVKLIKAIVAQRSYKTTEEIQQIEIAVNTTIDMQLKAMQLAAAGVTETEISGQLHAVAIAAGGHISFPVILTTNGQFLHNHPHHTPLQQGQLVLCDCGAENAMRYCGDLTRTHPVDKKFTTAQRDIYDIVYQSYQAAADAIRPGIRFKDIHLLACEQIAAGLTALGLMKGDPREAVAAGAHALFFPCGVGHMLGLDIHDMENLGEAYVGYTDTLQKSTAFGLKSLRLGRELEAGFVLTVEPGIYFNPLLTDAWQAAGKHTSFINYEKLAAYRNFGGIRLEDNFLVTAEGSHLLGRPFARTATEIENLIASL